MSKSIPILLLLTFLASSCAAPPLPIPTPTLIPTNTPIPTPTFTPTPASPLALSGCPFYEECPGVTNLHELVAGDLEYGSETYVEFPYSVPLRINLGWYALDDQTLAANLEHLRFFFRVDGNDYTNDSMFRYGYYYDEQGNPTDYPGYFMGVVLSGWEIGQPHLIEYGYTIDAPINDGWYDSQPGTVTYIIRAVPVWRPPSPPTHATNTPHVLTPTPSCPSMPASTSRTPPARPSTSTHRTGHFHFYLQPGDNYLNVCEGVTATPATAAAALPQRRASLRQRDRVLLRQQLTSSALHKSNPPFCSGGIFVP